MEPYRNVRVAYYGADNMWPPLNMPCAAKHNKRSQNCAYPGLDYEVLNFLLEYLKLNITAVQFNADYDYTPRHNSGR